MIVCRNLTAVVALFALLLGAACSDRDGAQIPAETDEPLFVQAMQLKKQGRNSEALTSFLKVIEKRGERAAAESHLEAGSLYLNHTKDPVSAYYHFRKYLELQPNSKQAPYVRGMVDAAKREFYRTLAAAPREDASSRIAGEEDLLKELGRVRRENDELRAELQTLRGTPPAAAARAPRMIPVPEETRPRSTPTPPPAQAPAQSAAPSRQPSPGPTLVAPVQASPSTARPTAPRVSSPASGRTHTVAAKDTLWGIARKYYGTPTAANVRAIRDANPGINTDALREGTVLRIP
jgi:phage tail protein X